MNEKKKKKRPFDGRLDNSHRDGDGERPQNLRRVETADSVVLVHNLEITGKVRRLVVESQVPLKEDNKEVINREGKRDLERS